VSLRFISASFRLMEDAAPSRGLGASPFDVYSCSCACGINQVIRRKVSLPAWLRVLYRAFPPQDAFEPLARA
jgi:hypothetical protein